MKITTKLLLLAAFIVLALPLVFTGNASAVVFNPDGLQYDATTNMWKLPTFGSAGIAGCYDGTTTIVDEASDPNVAPDASRFKCYNQPSVRIATQSICTAAGTAGNTPAGWTASVAINRWNACDMGGYSAGSTNSVTDCAANGGTVTGFSRCNRSVPPADCTSLPTYTFTSTGTNAASYTCTTTGMTIGQCTGFSATTTSGLNVLGSTARNAGTGVITCSIYVADAPGCTTVGGAMTFGVDETRGSCGAAWIFKSGTVGDWGSSVRNNCTKCHNPVYMASAGTDFETFEGELVHSVRDAGTVSQYMNASHKNASRKIVPGQPLVNVYLDTDGVEKFGVFNFVPGGFSGAEANQIRRIDWVNGKIEDTTGGLKNLPTNVYTEWYWEFGYYGEDPERGVFNMEVASTGKPLAKLPACFKCHATGYVMSSAADATKEPELSFPGISWNGTATYALGSRPGVVNFVGAMTNRTTNVKTTSTYGAWDQMGVVCSRCHNAAGGSHTSGGDGEANPSNGYQVNAVCGQCHIRAGSGDWAVTAGTGALATRSAVGTGHPNWHETDFLNSPHARFTGTIGSVATSSMYNSAFGTEIAPGGGAIGGGCTGCHNPHGSVREFFEELAIEEPGDPHGTEESLGPLDGVERGCAECHITARGNSYPITTFRHPTDPNKPTPWATPDPCATCHMQGGRHLFRVTTDVNYTTTQATTFPAKSDGTTTEAVWQDLKGVCQQCHSGHVAGIPFIQTADLRTFANGFHGGPVEPEAFVMNVSGTADLVTSKKVNFTATGCPGATCTYKWDFGDTGTTGTGSPASGATPSFTYDTAGTKSAQVIIVDTDAASPTFNKNAAKATVVTASAVANVPPVPSRTITKAGWTVNVKDASTDDTALPAGAIFVDWGNGTTSTGNAGSTISKIYTVAGSYIIKHKVTDAAGAVVWTSPNVSVTVPEKFTVSGSVMRGVCSLNPTVNTTQALCIAATGTWSASPTVGLSGASMRLKKGAVVKYITSTNASGAYTFTNVNPDTYTVEAVSAGFTFIGNNPAADATSGNATAATIYTTR